MPYCSIKRCCTPQGVCGLKQVSSGICKNYDRCTPQGVCGLKLESVIKHFGGERLHPARGVWIETRDILRCSDRSCKLHPARGVWIETLVLVHRNTAIQRLHPARGVWIETPDAANAKHALDGCTPQGVCGLKRIKHGKNSTKPALHPARGVWIETCLRGSRCYIFWLHPARGVWIETSAGRTR